jgi:hypothetical protein
MNLYSSHWESNSEIPVKLIIFSRLHKIKSIYSSNNITLYSAGAFVYHSLVADDFHICMQSIYTRVECVRADYNLFMRPKDIIRLLFVFRATRLDRVWYEFSSVSGSTVKDVGDLRMNYSRSRCSAVHELKYVVCWRSKLGNIRRTCLSASTLVFQRRRLVARYRGDYRTGEIPLFLLDNASSLYCN